MKYRTNKRTGDQISEIGMGTAHIIEAEKKDAARTVRHAFENGIIIMILPQETGQPLPLSGMHCTMSGIR